MRNPVTGGDHADKTPAVKDVLPGGSKYELFKARLDALAISPDRSRVDLNNFEPDYMYAYPGDLCGYYGSG